MKAVILATGAAAPQPDGSAERAPMFLTPLLDRPFLQHVVEYIVDSGLVETVEFVLHHMPERVEGLFGNGERWGVTFRYHLVRDPARCCGPLAALSAEGAPVLLADAETLPGAPLKEYREQAGPVAFRGDSGWSGWAILDAPTLSGIRPGWAPEELERHVAAATAKPGGVRESAVVLGVHSFAGVIASQRLVLEKRFTGLLFNGRQTQEGVWLCRNVTMHPTATLVPPVFVGENSRIGSGVRLGPNAVVANDCLVGKGTIVADSTILPGSYVGQELELDHVIVDRNRLINVRADGEIILHDDFLLSGMALNPFRAAWTGLLSRASALLLIALTWPLLLVTALGLALFRKGPLRHPVRAVRLPAPEGAVEWPTYEWNGFAAQGAPHSVSGHFLLRFLPGLLAVLRGHLHLVGVEPRTPEAVRALPSDWRFLYLKARAGLVTEAFATFGESASEDEIYTAEAFYSVAAGPRHDLRILLRYAAGIFRPRRHPEPEATGRDRA